MSASLMTDEDSTSTPRQIRFVEGGPVLVPPSPTLPAYKNQELRSNLMRHLADRDPLDYYEIISVLGVGSMGSVAKVRKRPEAIGGSARSANVIQKDDDSDCINPFVWFQQWMAPLTNRGLLSSSPDMPTSLLLRSNSDASSRKKEFYYALKSIHLANVTNTTFIEELKNEIEIMKKLDHPHIVRPIEVFQHCRQVFIVMELCSGGDLYTRDPYTEADAARIVSSILSAVSFMHQQNVVHRDLKYENIMFVNDSPKSEIKLIDFGLSKIHFHDSENLTEGVGTIYTMAPEVLKGHYTSQADIWSVGVIAYMLLSSQMPFYGRQRAHIIEQIMNCQFDFKGRRWKKVSAQAKAFVEDLLVLDPDERASADSAFRNMWLNQRFTTTVRGPTDDEMDMTVETFQKFAGYSKLKKLALMIIAHKSTAEEIGILRKVFQRFDTKKKGQIVFEEFKLGFAEYDFSDEELAHLFKGIDVDGTGVIRYTEFLAATIEAHGAIDEGRLAEAFDRLDSDDSGFISVENLSEILGDQFPLEEITAILKECSLRSDNRIYYPEFLTLWQGHSELTNEGSFSLLPTSTSTDRSDMSELTEADSQMDMDMDMDLDDDAVARSNYMEVKMMSQRKLEDAQKIAVDDATNFLFQNGNAVVTFSNTVIMATSG